MRKDMGSEEAGTAVHTMTSGATVCLCIGVHEPAGKCFAPTPACPHFTLSSHREGKIHVQIFRRKGSHSV